MISVGDKFVVMINCSLALEISLIKIGFVGAYICKRLVSLQLETFKLLVSKYLV